MEPDRTARRRRRLGLGGALAVAVVVLSACTGGDPLDSSTAQEDLDYYTYVRQTMHDLGQESQARTYGATQAAIAACMDEHGFIYVPPAFERSEYREYDSWTLSVDDAEERGYFAVPTRPTEQDELEDWEADWMHLGAQNMPLLRSMSPAEREAWLDAYAGTDADTPGCAESAVTAIQLPQHPGTLPEYGPLQDELSRLDNQHWTRSELADTLDAWHECLDLAGYPKPDEVEDGVFWSPEHLVRQAVGEVSGSVIDPQDISDDTWEAVAAYEISVAVADARCQEQVGLAEELRAAADRVRIDFVRDHRTELDAYVAALQEWTDQ